MEGEERSAAASVEAEHRVLHLQLVTDSYYMERMSICNSLNMTVDMARCLSIDELRLRHHEYLPTPLYSRVGRCFAIIKKKVSI